MPSVLCICRNGNSRSVALAWVLQKHNVEAIPIGIRKTTPETRQLLYGWASHIILVAGRYADELRPELSPADLHKLLIWDVGPDKWFRGFADDLVAHYQARVAAVPELAGRRR